ncbi:hypothetical protein BO71DRAFT_401056 [Aspergillus ellipticus CBS 707.79]|uniref:DUF3669 domain-containing protein n=1 Tax=Aspergillus ellipticus CBS 707.79 TaxID=1448320 RepID=A0A319D401_9EURO|nr:hypothetical protein BO71DRAFT_401056 [Aspergillus ellipticus CBS 707.79]
MTSSYHCIGRGFCGTVWATDEGPALKREDGGMGSLVNDYIMHQRVLYSFTQLSQLKRRKHPTKKERDDTCPQIRIPECHRFMTADNPWWKENLSRFPDRHLLPCSVLESQRIPPFPDKTRELIVERYCHPTIREQILACVANKDCLIRPYLGRRRTQKNEFPKHSRFAAFSLRNYPLHEDQMEELRIPIRDMERYAETMGEALATLHWIGEVDGNGVEFVLAPALSSDQNITVNVLGGHTMWIMDFDACESISMDLEGAQQAVTAFWQNDPYFPRPQTPLWNDFRKQYLKTSDDIASAQVAPNAEERLDLARLFIGLIEGKARDLSGGAPVKGGMQLNAHIDMPVPDMSSPWIDYPTRSGT